MTESEAAFSHVLKTLEDDRQDLIDLCITIGNLPDYSGHERASGEAVANWLLDAGIEAWLQYLSEDSVNAVGVLRGVDGRNGNGRSLIFNAHIDTQGGVPAGGEEAEQRIRGAWLDGDLLYGQGLANDKAQLAAEMLAMRAIKKAGVHLTADLFVTGVAQETSAPFDTEPSFSTWSGVGPKISQIREGFGCRWLIEHGVVADYALVGEITDFTVSVAQAGYLRLRIAVPGTVAYTPALARGAVGTGSPNPFERAGHLIVAIEQWARNYEQEYRHEFWGGTIIPKAQIYEIQSSGPAWTEANDHCLIFLDVRLVPNAKPTEIQHSLKTAMRETGVACEITPYDYKRGFIAEGADPLIGALRDAHQRVFNNEPEFANSIVLSMWRDANAFNEAGIPAIGYGPKSEDPKSGTGLAGLAGVPRPIAVSDLVDTAKVYALTAMNICGIDTTAVDTANE